MPKPFTEAVSFSVPCKDQKELDHYWNTLSEGGDPNAQICGWLKDRYGLSWQIVPDDISELVSDPIKGPRVMTKVVTMKKLDLEVLRSA